MLATPKYSKAIKISYLLGGGRQLESSENDYDGPGRFLKSHWHKYAKVYCVFRRCNVNM